MTIQKTWNVRFYQTRRGEKPVKDFISTQDPVVYAKIVSSMMLLQSNGPFLKPPQIKKLQSNLYELRIKGKIQIRIFYTIFRNEYYLLHAFTKKTQKTPAKELKITVDRAKEII
jgi:phage-related protein